MAFTVNQSNNIIGTEGDDFIIGTSGDDLISSSSGNDYIFSGGGDDYMMLVGGSHLAVAGTGNDDIVVAAGEHRVYGGSGEDQVAFLGGDTVAYGGTGADTFIFHDHNFNGETAKATIADFDTSEDVIAIVEMEAITAEGAYEMFLDGAVQNGNDVVYTDADGFVAVLENVDLDDISVNNFANLYEVEINIPSFTN